MSQQEINVGTTANDRKGDSLRIAFQKVNANFTELYTALGLDQDDLNLGAFEFNGSTMTTTDSSSIVIDQATTVSSDLTVGGDILPSIANGGDLGSSERPWRSLYVSNNTVFLGGVPLSLEAGTNELKINNVPISQTITYADIPNIPADISDLTDTGNLLAGSGADTGDITFAATTISVADQETITIQTTNQNSAASAKVIVDGDYGVVKLESYALEDSQGYYAEDNDYITGEWINSTTVRFTGAADLYNFLESLGSSTTWSFSVDGGERSVGGSRSWDGGTETLTIYTDGVTGSGSIDQIVFYYISKSYINLDYNDYSEIAIRGAGLDIGISTNQDILIASGNNTEITGSDSLRLESGATFRLINNSADQPIQIRTNASSSTKIWSFNPAGSITFPDSTTQTTAYTGDYNDLSNTPTIPTLGNFTLSGNNITASSGAAPIVLKIFGGDAGDPPALISREWTFGTDGNLTIPSNGRITLGDDGFYITTTDISIYGLTVAYTSELQSAYVSSLTGGTIATPATLTVNGNVDFTNATITGVNNFTVGGILQIEDGVHEKFSPIADATGVVNHDYSTGHIFYHTSPDANWTINLTNLNLSSGYATTVTIIIEQGNPGFYPSALQIGGAAQTINWQGNTLPTPSISRTDVVTFSIFNNSGTYTVLGQLAGF